MPPAHPDVHSSSAAKASGSTVSSGPAASSVRNIRNFIHGEFCETSSYLDSYNPSLDVVNAHVPDSTAADVERAVAAAQRAFPLWKRTPRGERARLLRAIADGIEARFEEFVAAESADQGKPEWLARMVDIPRAAYNFRFFAEHVLHTTGKTNAQDAGRDCISYTTSTPVGVAALISPWNLPLYLLTWKIAPALAAGCTVVAKPSEITSVTAHMLCEVIQSIGLPHGVFNAVFGLGATAGAALVSHPEVPLVSFTGGTATGTRIAQLAAPLHKKLSLELGGKNPALVFADADLDEAVAGVLRSSFTNQGEICLCSSRIYVHKDIFRDFVARLVDKAKKLRVGPPTDRDSFYGALASREHMAKVKGFVERAAATEGATIECGWMEGGQKIAKGGEGGGPAAAALLKTLPDTHKRGYFFPPTIITGLTQDHEAVQEEIFGPVVCVLPFGTEAEAVELANDVKYGLSATIWTRDGRVAHRVARELDAGTVWINTWLVRDLLLPFGGFKASGTGRESGDDSLRFFTEAKTVCFNLAG